MRIQHYTIHSKYGSAFIDKVPEDAFCTGAKHPVAVVADGVTILDRNRDGSYPVFPDGESGAKKAADVFCAVALSYLEKRYFSVGKKEIRAAFRAGNQAVQKLNKKLLHRTPADPEYGPKSFAAVAAMAYVKNRALYYGFLTDCGVAVVGKDARLTFITPEIWPRIKKPSEAHVRIALKKIKGGYYNYRKYVRNNPDFVSEKEFYSHGVINGQEGALNYVETGQRTLSAGDNVVVFSDGFRNYFKHGDFLKILSKSKPRDIQKELDTFGFRLLWEEKRSLQEYGAERTLAVIKGMAEPPMNEHDSKKKIRKT